SPKIIPSPKAIKVLIPDMDEGQLTKIRANIVSDKNLALLAKKINLGNYIAFSYGEKSSGGQKKLSILADGFEALIGAYYFDQGIVRTRTYFLNFLKKHTNKLMTVEKIRDYKTELQELLQQHKCDLPKYVVSKEEGPAHERVFYVQAKIKCKQPFVAQGKGNTKKEAEQKAAEKAFNELKSLHKNKISL
ncbi:ribonuclease III family protein, partial [Candidatus Margulisiibacteriota bacterium]